MDRNLMEKLRAATDGILLPEARVVVSQSVAKCREMSCPDTENCKTKPKSAATVTGRRTHGLSPRQRAAVEKLVAGRSVAAAARELGVEPRTVFRWKNDARFRQAIDERLEKMSGESRLSARPTTRAALDDLEPTPEERKAMERTFALAGITPSWQRERRSVEGQAGNKPRNVAVCRGLSR